MWSDNPNQENCHCIGAALTAYHHRCCTGKLWHIYTDTVTNTEVLYWPTPPSDPASNCQTDFPGSGSLTDCTEVTPLCVEIYWELKVHCIVLQAKWEFTLFVRFFPHTNELFLKIGFFYFSSILYLNYDDRRDIWWNIGSARGKSQGWSPRDFLRAIFHRISRLES